MSDHDEFESLIKNFRLDDVEEELPDPAPVTAESRRPFDYEQDTRRHTAARAPSAPRQELNPPRQERYAHRQPQPVPMRAAQDDGEASERISSHEEKRRHFHVNIDESEFLEPVAPPPVPPSRGGGGGGRGNGPNRPSRGRREEPDDDGGSGGSTAGRWLKALLVLLIVLGVSGFLALFALQSASDMFGLNKPDGLIEVELPEDQSLMQIASLLKENEIITQPLVFQLYAGLKPGNSAENFIPGTYTLNTNMSYDEIMRDFRTGNIKRIEVEVMFREGMTLGEIAAKLEETNVCTEQELYDYLEAGDFPWSYRFLEQIPEKDDVFRRWEGYFFPDTYIFYEEMGPEGVTQKFFSNFNNKMTDKLYERMEEMNLTLDETITLASVIQKEAGLAEDMVGVARVFHNRLAQDSQLPKLQSDVTRDYVNLHIKPFLPDAVDKEKTPDKADPNQAMYDAYNTYVCDGLPAGPVCNPGIEAVRAALELKLDGAPNISYEEYATYYYFVTDQEGKYYYAATFDQHEQNVAVASQVGEGEVHGVGIPSNEAEGQP